MPIVKAYKASITLEGKTPNSSIVIYNNVRHAYGETIGEMHDNLVEASILLAKDFQKFLDVRKPIIAPDDYFDAKWFLNASMPDILKSYNIESPYKNYENGWGCTVENPLDVVRQTTVWREVGSTMLLSLLVISGGASNINYKAIPGRSCSDSSELTDFHEIATYGFNGHDLDKNLKIAEEEGRISEYLSKNDHNWEKADTKPVKKRGLFSFFESLR